MQPAITLAIYCLLIVAASLAGGLVPLMVRLTHKRLELAISFVGGSMLGVGLLHMLPHAFQMRLAASTSTGLADEEHSHELFHALVDPVVLWLLAGFLAMFFIERFFCFHHHDVPAAMPPTSTRIAPDDQAPAAVRSHGDDHTHDLDQHPDLAGVAIRDDSHRRSLQGSPISSSTRDAHRHKLTWAGAAVGLSLHSLIEGVALAASVEAARHQDQLSWLAGAGVFLVIFLHKPLDSLTIGALMSVSGRSGAARHVVNLAFSLLVPIGVLGFYAGAAGLEDGLVMVGAALAFSAGTFLCIAMSDLLPELQFHQHDRGKLSAALLAGVALAWAIGRMEATMHTADLQHEHGHATGVELR